MIALKKITFVFFMLLVIANPAYAMPSVSITVEPVFHEGDTIVFSYEIVSQKDESVTYVANVDCTGSPAVMMETHELDLMMNEPFSGEYVYGVVGKDVKSGGRCIASVSVIEPDGLEVTEPFEVITLLDFSLDVSFCKTSVCTQETKVFILGEDVHINYESGTENSIVTATLTLPDGTARQLSLPATIKADQVGTYELSATASKEGYRTVTDSTQFGVIEAEADIPYILIEDEPPLAGLDYTVLIAAIIVVLAVVITVFFYKKKQKFNEEWKNVGTGKFKSQSK